ncbi:MAG: DUF1403 family protein, partial [Mesorhizobium sp.]
GDVIFLLLNEDAVAGSLTTKNLSRFGARRLFERLQQLEAVRELSGRATSGCLGFSDEPSLRPPQAERAAGTARHRA